MIRTLDFTLSEVESSQRVVCTLAAELGTDPKVARVESEKLVKKLFKKSRPEMMVA